MKRKSIKRVIGAVLTTSLLVSMLGVTNVAVFADDKETVRILVPGLSEQSTIDQSQVWKQKVFRNFRNS